MSQELLARSSSGVEMADLMRSSGKIYVVIGTIAVTFLGLAFYLYSIDRKLKKIEKEDRLITKLYELNHSNDETN